MFRKKILWLVLVFGTNTLLAQSRFVADVDTSNIFWEGTNIGGGGHDGFIKLLSGVLILNDKGLVTDGEFTIDMNTLKSTDVNGGTGLDDHLKNEDFFHVWLHPYATFSITGWEGSLQAGKDSRALLTGNLTIKGISQVISFPAEITWQSGAMRAQSEFTIDRTRWGINYQSGSVFSALKDNIIRDEIALKLDLTLHAK